MRKVVSLIALLAIVATGLILVERHQVESENRQVALFMDGTELLFRSRLTGLDLQAYLHELKAAGLYGVASHVVALRDMVPLGDIDIHAAGAEARAAADELGLRWPNPTQTLLHVKRPELVAPLIALVERLSGDRLETTVFGHVIYTEVPYERLRRASLGFPKDLMAAVRAAGLTFLPVFSPFSGSTAAEFAAFLDTGEFAGVMFTGNRIAENLAGSDLLSEVIARRGLTFYWLQRADTLRSYVPLEGVEDVLTPTTPIVRAYRISRAETNNPAVTPENMTARWINSITDYNVRAIYMRPFFREPDIAYNTHYTRYLVAAVERLGLTLGSATGFRRFFPHPLLQAGVGLGIGLLCYLLALKAKIPRVLANLGLVGVALLQIGLFTPWALWVRLGLGLIGAVAASFAALAFFRDWKCPWQGFFLINLTTTLLALLVASYLSDWEFIKEFHYFRGVKVQYSLPIVLFAAMLWLPRLRQLPQEILAEIRRFGLWKSLAAVLFLGVVFYIYLRRSGHAHAIGQFELNLRFWLDEVLVARPRFKEMLVHPVLLVVLYYRQRLPRLIMEGGLVASVIAQVSIVNSFMHLRTPLAISLLRVFHGLWLGTLLGLMALGGVALLWKGYEAYVAGAWRAGKR
ncbi:MAG: hypothetical protein KGZ66_10590 [Selenomonadales bacterium]|nr:hypothetical protein [Selenomonadales bacterium]